MDLKFDIEEANLCVKFALVLLLLNTYNSDFFFFLRKEEKEGERIKILM